MTVTDASVNGRRITLDPIEPMGEFEVPLKARQVESSLPAGFRIGWVDGTVTQGAHPGEAFDLTVGAGVGSPWGIFDYRGVQIVFNVHSIVESMIAAIDADLDTCRDVGAKGVRCSKPIDHEDDHAGRSGPVWPQKGA